MSWTAERARVASLTRSRTPDDPELVAARAALAAARAELAIDDLEAHIERIVSAAPPISPERRARLTAILTGGGSR